MDIKNLLARLSENGIGLAARDGALLCSDPRKQLTDELREAIKLRKPELLRVLAQQRDSRAAAPIPRSAARAAYPATSQQKRIYALQKMEPASVAYNMPIAFEIAQNFDPQRLQEALDALAGRHEILRTRFESREQGLQQVVEPFARCALETDDAPEADLGRCLQSFLRPFDLERAPLLRARALLRPDGGATLLLDMHHIVSDGISNAALMAELAALYAGKDLPEPALQYRDYAVWQQEGAGRALIEAQRAHWLEQFAEAPPALSLPADFARPARKDYRGAAVERRLSPEATARLRDYCAERGATPFMALLAAFSATLAKVAGQDDVVVGTPVSGRSQDETARIPGMFVNTLAIRSKPAPEKPFRQHLEETRRLSLAAFENQLYPFEELVGQLDLPRDASRNPLFDAMFAMQNFERATASEDLGPIRALELPTTTAKFDVTLSAYIGEGGLDLHLEYATSLFGRDSAERLLRRVERMLAEAVDDDARPIGDIDAMEPEERALLLDAFNDSGFPLPADKRVHDFFEQQAAAAPDAAALVFEGQTMTYAELDARAGSLAAALREGRALAPDTIVGLMARRSFDMHVGQLAILKAGCAYLPIDPTYPPERIAFMLEDSGCALLLKSAELDAPEGFAGKSLDIGQPREAQAPTVESAARADSLAYVIYTSGSTGKPKGVMIEHRNVVNFALAMQRAVGLKAGERIVSATTICFDIFVLESLVPLMLGMSVAIASERDQRDPQALGELVRASGAQYLQATPSLAQALAARERSSDWLGGVETFLIGGEAFPDALFHALRASAPAARIVNVYGPTETTVWSTYGELERVPADIGRPLGNNRVYLLDARQRLRPLGSIGEICIAGDGVARGYLGRPELTAERFVENPLEPSGRLYRTGDLGKWLPDGRLLCLGRSDGQVKLRGHRIELGEIESALLAAGAREAAVLVRELAGEPALVAYLASDAPLDLADLRARLRQSLPAYMIPARFAFLDRLPLTANGKLDRRALPDPGQADAAPRARRQPATDTERALAELWAKALRLEDEPALDDNFFESGGHSLQLVDLVSRAREAFGREVEYADFADSTLEEIALKIDETEPAQQAAAAGSRASRWAKRLFGN